MAKVTRKQQLIIDQILLRFNLNKLCPTCNGPLEIENEIRCVKCSMKAHIKSNIEYAEVGLHEIKNAIGMKNIPIHRQATKKKIAKRKPTTKKKTTAKRKTATKRKAKK